MYWEGTRPFLDPPLPSGLFPCTISFQWRIQDFPEGGAPTPIIAIIFLFFSENCVKMKKFEPPREGWRSWWPLGSGNAFVYSLHVLLAIITKYGAPAGKLPLLLPTANQVAGR